MGSIQLIVGFGLLKDEENTEYHIMSDDKRHSTDIEEALEFSTYIEHLVCKVCETLFAGLDGAQHR